MLLQLKINNYLLIENLELDFHSGLTVVTGETGSGKSIIIDALMLVFGARSSRDIVRIGTLHANFEAVFSLTNQQAADWLKENDLLDIDNPESVICRRIVDNHGKSKSQINGYNVTSAQIRILGDYILDIHTQHASITLLKSDTQRNLLDQFCGIGAEVDNLSKIYYQIQDLSAKLLVAKASMRDLELKREILSEKIDELSLLNLGANEWESLQNEHKQLSNATEVLAELDYTVNALANDEGSIVSGVANIHSRLSKISNYVPELADILKILDSIDIELGELGHEVNALVRNINQDPEKLAQIEMRMDEIFLLSRKYRIEPNQISKALVVFQDELGQLEQDINIDKLEEQLAILNVEYKTVAGMISKARKIGADKLGVQATELLHKLAIRGSFNIALTATDKLTSFGLENIEYQVSFNQGMPLQALASAASGGELSRIALTLYLLLSMHNPPEVIIFDEIDVGIGGKIAAVVGQMLANLGQTKQVLCITHQPQAASFGNHHLLVSKAEVKNLTVTHANYIFDGDRVNEIARMLGGVHITAATIVHAKEMLSGHASQKL